MGQREVTDAEIRAAESEAHAAIDAKTQWWAHRRTLKDGRVMYLFYQGRGMSIGISSDAHTRAFDETFDYFHSGYEGWKAVLGWDEEGEPDGWCRAKGPHATKYRRRPDGDATHEYEAP